VPKDDPAAATEFHALVRRRLRFARFDANHAAAHARGRISPHPDGTRVAYATKTSSSIEVWALENSLARSSTRQ
jgi:hypothetical protein